MRHDELKAKVFQEYATTYEDLCGNVPASPKALFAVVELHKPEWVLPMLTLFNEKPEPIAICSHCSSVAEFRKIYPCPTIQAIEEELA